MTRRARFTQKSEPNPRNSDIGLGIMQNRHIDLRRALSTDCSNSRNRIAAHRNSVSPLGGGVRQGGVSGRSSPRAVAKHEKTPPRGGVFPTLLANPQGCVEAGPRRRGFVVPRRQPCPQRRQPVVPVPEPVVNSSKPIHVSLRTSCPSVVKPVRP